MSNQISVPLAAGKITTQPRKTTGTFFGPAPVTPVSPTPVTPPPLTCFLAGSTVFMADGTIKAIELVEAGEYVVGAFGEINEVLALDRTMLGARPMYRINSDHSTTAEHPHVGIDRKFYAQDTEATYSEYGTEHRCLVKNGGIKELVFHGVRPGVVNTLYVGLELQTVGGAKKVESIEKYNLPESTLLFNLVVGGSHTYTVNGYAVSGWIRDDDFDYETWTNQNVQKVDVETYNISRAKELV